MNLIQKLRFFRELADKLKQLQVADRLDQAADIAEQVEQALRYAADLAREYLGTPTVGAEGNDGELSADLAQTESALMAVYPMTVGSAGSLSPAVIPIVVQLLIEVIRLIREKRKA